MPVAVSELSDLILDDIYTVTRYIKCRGSCGHYYFVEVERFAASEHSHDSSNKITVFVRPDNNLYDYLQQKRDNFKFTIIRSHSHLNDSYLMVDGNGNWVDLI